MSQKIPVLILAHSYPPVSHSGSERPARFAKYLSRVGHHVEVMTSTQFLDAPHSPGVHRIPQIPKTGAGAVLRKSIWRACAPLRHYDYGLTWILDSTAYAMRLASKPESCCIISTYPPISTHLTALRIKRRLSVKWIADFRDPFVGNPFRPRHAFVRRADRWLEETIVGNADAVLTNTDHLADELRARYPQWAGKVAVLWNGYDPEEEFGPLPIPPRAWRVLAHVGTIYGGRHPGLLIDSLDRLAAAGRGRTDALKLQQIGSIEATEMPNRDRFDEWAREGRVQLSGERVPRKDALRAIAEADLLLLLDLNTTGTSTQVPAKIFDYVRAGRPILAFTNHDSPTEEILARCGIPHRIVYRDDPPERIDCQVEEFLGLSSEPVRPGEWFLQRFDGARQAGELADMIERL